MKIIEFTDPWECHECGEIHQRMKIIWLDHLCQHGVFLCPKCFLKLIRMLNKYGKD
jgi:hypothetical protein